MTNTDSDTRKEVIAYTDGSSLGNGQTVTRAAGAAILSHNAMVKAFAEYFGTATNQQAEIRAAILAVRSLTQPCRLHVITDSKYVVETMRGNFKRKANNDLWDELDRAIADGGHAVTFQWTRGHNGNAKQEAADELARAVAAAGRVEPYLLRQAVRSFNQGAEDAPAPVAAALSRLTETLSTINAAAV